MLEVKNLTKVYKSKHRKKVKALNSVSFTLPNSGMVFIIGKSGSGKSTLLNMLGGLDEIIEGEIIVNGNRFSTFSHEDYDNYRNTCVGFIFQDFHLLDDLTVGENVALSLDLQRSGDKEKVSEALKRVDLEGYEKRYPVELSGGQKQRVAIARALVKNPSVLLADEPTGNLDSKTTGQVLDLLKEISKTKLVLIVSHNLNDADKYADRILELSDGVILNDLSRRLHYNENVEVHHGVMRIPYLKKFTRADEFITYGLYFDELDDITSVYETGTELGYVPNSVTVQSTATMTRAVSVFSDFFFLISLVLYVGCASVLVNFGVKAVRGKTYEIGVIKALGGKSKDLSFIFTVEILLVGILTCVFSWIGLYLFIGVANDVLVASLAELATSHVVKDMNFLVFNPTIMTANSVGVFVLTLLSSFIPMLTLKNIKPINIIKAKE